MQWQAVIAIIKEKGPHLGLFIKDSKWSNTENLVLLGAPIGDLIFCAKLTSSLRSKISDLLSSFCKLVHLARSTPPSLVAEALSFFDSDCFTECTSVDVSDIAWHQAQLSPIVEEERTTIWSSPSMTSTMHIIGESEAVSVQDILDAPPRQRNLSSKIEDHQLRMLFDLASSPAQRARLLSVSSPHASAWLSVMPTPQLNLHLEPPEFQVALKWWLGMDTSQNACCAFCPSHALDPLGHHALTCKSGGDLIVRHNALRDTFLHGILQAGMYRGTTGSRQ
eukprot:Em0011g201a